MKDKNAILTMSLEDKKGKIAYILQSARIQKGLTQEELGERVNMSRNTIVRIENKRFFPSMESLLLILDCLDLPLKINNHTI